MLGDTIVLVGNSSKSGIGNEIGWDLHLPQNPKHIHDAHLTSLRQLQISTMLGTCGSLQSKAYTINSIVSNTCHWVKLAQSMQCTSFDMWASRPYEFHWSTKWPHTPPPSLCTHPFYNDSWKFVCLDWENSNHEFYNRKHKLRTKYIERPKRYAKFKVPTIDTHTHTP